MTRYVTEAVVTHTVDYVKGGETPGGSECEVYVTVCGREIEMYGMGGEVPFITPGDNDQVDPSKCACGLSKSF